MLYRLAADGLVLVHLLFLGFVVGGALLVFLRRWVAWLHLPAFLWGAAIEFGGWICPLTPLENRLRRLGGEAGYTGGFIEHYILPVIYPEVLTRERQVLIGSIVLLVNLAAYGFLWWRWRRKRRDRSRAARAS
jgi:hypothetical protein